MPDFNAFDFVQQNTGTREEPEPPRFDARAFVQSAQTQDEPESFAPAERMNREVAVATDRAMESLVSPPEAPLHMIQDSSSARRPLPRSIGEAITEAGSHGITLEMSEGLWEDLDGQARMLSAAFIKEAGGSLTNLDKGTFEDLVAAHRWTLVRLHSEGSDEEKDRILASAASQTLGVAMNRGMGRLNEVDTALQNEDGAIMRSRLEREQTRLREALARLQETQSLLAAGDPAARNAFRTRLQTALDKRDKADIESSLALRQLNSVFTNETPRLGADEFGIRNFKKAALSRADQLADDLDLILTSADQPDGTENVLRLAVNAANQQIKLNQLGVTPEQIENEGVIAAVRRNYPGLVEGAILQGATGQGTQFPAATVEKALDEPEFAGLIANAVDQAALSPTEQLKQFDPAQLAPTAPFTAQAAKGVQNLGTSLGKGIGTVIAAMDTFLEGVGDRADVVARSAGLKLEPWQQAEADRQRIRLGIKEGDVDVATLMRWTGAGKNPVGFGLAYWLEHAGDGPASDASIRAWQLTGRGEDPSSRKLGLGKVLAEKLQGIPTEELKPDLVGALATDAMRELAEESLDLPDTRKRLAELQGRAADALRRGDTVEGIYRSVVAGLYQLSWVDAKETIGFVAQEPSAAPVMAAIGYAGGKAGGTLFKHADSALDRMAARATHTMRLRRHIRDLAAHDPKALENAVESFRKSPVKGLSEHKAAGMADIMEQLSEEAYVGLRDASRLTQRDHDRFWARRRGQVRDLDRHMRGLQTTSLEDVLDRMQVGEGVLNALRRPVRTSFLNEVAADVTNRMRVGGFRLMQGTRQRNLSNIAKRVTDALDNGTSIDEIAGMPVPLVGDDLGYRWWGRRMLDRIGQLGGRRVDVETTSLTAAVGRWVRDNVEVMHTLRDYNMLVRGRQKDLLNLAQRRNSNMMDTIRRHQTPNEAHAAEMARLQGRQQKLDVALQEVDARGWREKVELSKNDTVKDTLTFYDMKHWFESAHGEPARYEAWSLMARRKADGTMEGFDEFRTRLDEVEDLESKVFNNELTGKEREQAMRTIDRTKREFLGALYDRKTPTKFLDEPNEPLAFNQVFVKKMERRARELEAKLQKAIQDEDDELIDTLTAQLDEIPKVRKADLPRELRKIDDLKSTIEASDFEQVFEKNAGWDFGRPHEVVDFMRQLQIDRKNAIFTHGLRVQRFFEELSKATPDVRDAFDQMLSKSARGDYKSYDEFLNDHPGMLEKLYAADPDTNLGRAFVDMESLRYDLLNRLRKTGQLDEATYQTFVKPYAPQLYRADEFPSLVGQVVKESADARGGGTTAPSGVDVGVGEPFELQRDIYKTRLVIQKSGNEWVNKLFDSPGAAQAWVRERYGIRDLKAGDLGKEGVTDFGDRFRVVRPLGKEHAEKLGLFGSTQALGKRIAQLSREAGLRDVIKAIDRPGWTIDADAYLKAQQTARGRKLYRGFLEIKAPKNSALGILEGRYIHRRAASLIQNFLESENFMFQVERELVQAALADTPRLWDAPMKALTMVGGLGRVLHKLISTNLIARNLRTHVTNRWYDRQILARAAGGPSYLKSAGGQQAFRDAKQFLLGFDTPNRPALNAAKSLSEELAKLPDGERQLYEGAIRRGMIGDSLLGNPLRGELKKAMTENFFGPTEEKLIRKLSPEADKTVQDLQARLKQVTNTLEAWAADADPLKLDTVKRLQREAVALEEALAFNDPGLKGFGLRAMELGRTLIGIKKEFGTFGERQAYSTALYAREGNIDRLGVYLHLVRKGVPEDLAAKRVRMFMQDYSNIRGFVKVIRNSPIANPIFSFPAEWVRITGNMLREHPGFLLGMLGAAPTISALNIASTGVDPVEYYMAKAKGNWINALIEATGSLTLRNPDGEGVSTVEVPGLNPLQMFRKPGGFLGAVVDHVEKDGVDTSNPLAAAGSIATRFTGQIIFSNPLIDAGYTSLVGRDPLSQEKLEGGLLSRSGEALRQISRMLIPASLPWYSNASETVADALRVPPHMNTGRMTSAAERALQAYLGVKVRGGILEKTEDLIPGDAKPLSYGTRLLLQTINAAPPLPGQERFQIPRVLPRSKGFTEEDVATWLFYANKKFAVDGAEPGDHQLDSVQNDLRFAMFARKHGDETGDAAFREWGNRLGARAQERLAEQLRSRAAFAGIADDVSEQQLEREMQSRIRRAAEASDLGNQFAKADVNQQVRTLIDLSTMGMSDELITNLVERALFTNMDEFNPTTWTNPSAISIAADHITNHIETAERGSTGLDALAWFHAQLLRNEPKALMRAEEDRFRNQANSDAFEVWREFENAK